MTNEAGTEPLRRRRWLPVSLLAAWALAVWAVGVWHHKPHLPQGRPAGPAVQVGTAAELASVIRAAPRAVVYVGNPCSVQGVRGRDLFRAAAAELAAAEPDSRLQFFDIKDESAADSRAWAAALGDGRLDNFGYLAHGWVVWLEAGVVRDADGYAGHRDRISPREIVDRTRAVWP